MSNNHSQFSHLISNKSETLDLAINTLSALNSRIRLQILLFLHDEGETHVKRLYTGLQVEQSLASQQLKYLRDTELVLTKRDGQFIRYSINYPRLVEAANGLSRISH